MHDNRDFPRAQFLLHGGNDLGPDGLLLIVALPANFQFFLERLLGIVKLNIPPLQRRRVIRANRPLRHCDRSAEVRTESENGNRNQNDAKFEMRRCGS